MAPKELKPPPLVREDPNALELLRCWAAHEELHVTLSWDFWEDPADWGVLMVDLARHIASAFEQERGTPQDQTLANIRRAIEEHWDDPDDGTLSGEVED